MFSNLPSDNLYEICSDLKISDLYRLSLCSKKFYGLFMSEKLWKLISFRDFNVENIRTAHRVYINGYVKYKDNISYYILYKKLYLKLLDLLSFGVINFYRPYINFERMVTDFFTAFNNSRMFMDQKMSTFIDEIKYLNENKLLLRGKMMDVTEMNSDIHFKMIHLETHGIVPIINIRKGEKDTILTKLNTKKQEFFRMTNLEYKYYRPDDHRFDATKEVTINYFITFIV